MHYVPEKLQFVLQHHAGWNGEADQSVHRNGSVGGAGERKQTDHQRYSFNGKTDPAFRPRELLQFLKDRGILDSGNAPYQKYVAKGYFKIWINTYYDKNGQVIKPDDKDCLNSIDGQNDLQPVIKL